MEPSGNELHWRETYYILFPSERRPSLTQVDGVLGRIDDRYLLKNQEADEEGRFESILVDSPDDHAALEISYEMGDSVIEQSLELAKQLRDEVDTGQLKSLMRSDARLDVMHFERVAGGDEEDEWGSSGEDELDEMLDPTTLLLAVEALATLVDGIPIDPASGSVLV